MKTILFIILLFFNNLLYADSEIIFDFHFPIDKNGINFKDYTMEVEAGPVDLSYHNKNIEFNESIEFLLNKREEKGIDIEFSNMYDYRDRYLKK